MRLATTYWFGNFINNGDYYVHWSYSATESGNWIFSTSAQFHSSGLLDWIRLLLECKVGIETRRTQRINTMHWLKTENCNCWMLISNVVLNKVLWQIIEPLEKVVYEKIITCISRCLILCLWFSGALKIWFLTQFRLTRSESSVSK